jgi:hypothetical protein
MGLRLPDRLRGYLSDYLDGPAPPMPRQDTGDAPPLTGLWMADAAPLEPMAWLPVPARVWERERPVVPSAPRPPYPPASSR